ncbi:MAG: hypothetical protein WAL23_00385, partial [Nitrososphaeraceae archaeon]
MSFTLKANFITRTGTINLVMVISFCSGTFEQFISQYFISFLQRICKSCKASWARSSAWIERLPSKF